jgi:hypothetical protein
MVKPTRPQGTRRLHSVVGWGGLAALALGAAASAGASGIGAYRTKVIVDTPCVKNALDASALESWLDVAAAVLLIVAVAAFITVLVGANRHRAAARHAGAGLVVAILLLVPAVNALAGDPLGFDAQMLPNCATMGPTIEVR